MVRGRNKKDCVVWMIIIILRQIVRGTHKLFVKFALECVVRPKYSNTSVRQDFGFIFHDATFEQIVSVENSRLSKAILTFVTRFLKSHGYLISEPILDNDDILHYAHSYALHSIDSFQPLRHFVSFGKVLA